MISEDDRLKIKEQLGREPRGLQEIVCYNSENWPRVLRVSPIVDGKPFPSHYWLSCQILKKEIDKIEANGWIKKIEKEYLVADEEFRKAVYEDHISYIKDRLFFLERDDLLSGLENKYLESLNSRGVGGIQDFKRIRCLHMHYAHHLAKGNTIGRLMDKLFQLDEL